jgi:hypothetical protein
MKSVIAFIIGRTVGYVLRGVGALKRKGSDHWPTLVPLERLSQEKLRPPWRASVGST